MEARKWEELPMDCLVEVLGRVGSEMLLFDVPFVCKSWYKATLNPQCWKQLVFPQIMGMTYRYCEPLVSLRTRYRLKSQISPKELLKVVVERSDGCATMVDLSVYHTKEALTYVADKCPALKKLVLHSYDSSTMLVLLSLIGKLRNMESLEIREYLRFKDIVTEIGNHCEGFVALSLVTWAHEAYIGEKEVMAIVTSLPKIRCLTLRKVLIKRENLIKILKGCVNLVFLDVSDCRGFDEDDEELSKLASHIPTFTCSGSVFDTLDDSDGYDCYDFSYDFDSVVYENDGNDDYGHDSHGFSYLDHFNYNEDYGHDSHGFSYLDHFNYNDDYGHDSHGFSYLDQFNYIDDYGLDSHGFSYLDQFNYNGYYGHGCDGFSYLDQFNYNDDYGHDCHDDYNVDYSHDDW